MRRIGTQSVQGFSTVFGALSGIGPEKKPSPGRLLRQATESRRYFWVKDRFGINALAPNL
jgi:hypothetical protein